jgi:hypothetical protein
MEMGAFMCLKAGAKDLHSVNNTDFDRTIGADFLRFFFHADQDAKPDFSAGST